MGRGKGSGLFAAGLLLGDRRRGRGGGLLDLIRSLEPLGDLLPSILDPPGDRGDRDLGLRRSDRGGDSGLLFRGCSFPLSLVRGGKIRLIIRKNTTF